MSEIASRSLNLRFSVRNEHAFRLASCARATSPQRLRPQRILLIAESRLMHRFPLLIAVLPLFSAIQAADEIAVVTAEIGYLLNEAGEIADTASAFEAMDVEGSERDFLIVRRKGKLLRIHTGLVHRTSQFSDAVEESHAGLRQVFGLLRKAREQLAERRHNEASDSASEAAQVARRTFRAASTWEMWALQFQVSVLLDGQLNDEAARVLNRCLALMNELDAENEIHAADVFNTVGMFRVTEGDPTSAIKAYR